MRRVPFTVIGVLESKGQSMMGYDQDDLILMPLSTARKRVLGATNSWLHSRTHQSPYRYDKDRGYVCTLSALVLKRIAAVTAAAVALASPTTSAGVLPVSA